MKKSMPFLAALLFLLGACQSSEQPVADTTTEQEMKIVKPVSANASNNNAIVNNDNAIVNNAEDVVLEEDLTAVDDESVLVAEGNIINNNETNEEVLTDEELRLEAEAETVATDSLQDHREAVKANNEAVRKETQERIDELNNRKKEALKNAPKSNPAKDRVQALTKEKQVNTTQNNQSARVDQVAQLSQVMAAVYCNCEQANALKNTNENCDTKVAAIQKTIFRTVENGKKAAITAAYEKEVAKCKK